MNRKNDVANRLDYSVFRVEISNDNRKNRDTIIRSKLATLYPISLDNKELLMLKNAEDRKSRIVFICKKGFLKDNKQMICSSLLSMKLLSQKSGVCVIISALFIEYVTLVKGQFVTSTSVSRTEKTNLTELANGFDDNTIALISNRHDWELIKKAVSEKIHHFDVENISSSIIRQTKFYILSSDYYRKRAGFWIILLLLVILVGIGVVHQRVKSNSENRMIERSKNEMILRLEREKHQKKELMKNLQDEYLNIVRATLPDMFRVCSIIFSSIDNSTKIENITISGGKFQFDAHGNDAIAILNQFEKNELISGINLTKVVVEGKGDSFTFNGEVKQQIILPNADDSIDQKMAFFQDEINRFNQEEHIKRSRRSSEISKIIRQILSHNRCKLESIKYYNTEYGLEIEYAIQARSSAFFSFLEEALKSNEYLVASSVRIRSYLEGDTISAVIRFRSGIMLDDSDTDWDILSEEGISMTAEEMAEYFVSRRATPVALENEVVEPEAVIYSTLIRNPSFLQYVGFAGTSGGEQFVLIKDIKKDTIVKISNNPEQVDYFMSNNVNKLELKYEGTLYEVRK